jgi:hypothetical protein
MIVVFFIIHVKGICLAPWGFGGWRRGLVLVVFGVKSVWHRYYFEDKGTDEFIAGFSNGANIKKPYFCKIIFYLS